MTTTANEDRPITFFDEEEPKEDTNYCSLDIFDIETVPKSEAELEEMMTDAMKNPMMPMELEHPVIPTLDSFVNRALKDEEKLAKWREGKRDDWHKKHKEKIEKWQDECAADRIAFIEKAALHAECCIVKLIGVVSREGNYTLFTSDALTEKEKLALWSKVPAGDHYIYDMDSEQGMLESWWQYAGTVIIPDRNMTDRREQFATTRRMGGFNSNAFDLPMLRRKSWIHRVKPSVAVMNGRYVNREHFIDLLEEWQCGDRTVYRSAEAVAKALGLKQRKTGDGAQFGRMWNEDKVGAILYNIADLDLERGIAQAMGHV